MKTLLLLFGFISLLGFSQNTYTSNSLSVSMGDLETNYSELDSTANALVIHEYGKSFYNKNTYELNFEYKNKTKIFNRNGFENATISIYLYKNNNKKERIKNIRATTYNKVNGKIEKTTLSKSDIFEEKYNDNYTIVKFTLPNIQEGSVFTYSYELESPFMYKYQPWYFQAEIPKLYSEYNTSIPANYEYNIKLVGTLKLETNKVDRDRDCLQGPNGSYADCLVSQYIMKDIPPFKEEKYMTTKENYLSRIEYELSVFRDFKGGVDKITLSWDDADKELKQHASVGRLLGKSSGLKDLLPQDIVSETNTLEKAKKILAFVKNEFTYNDEFGLFKDNSVKDLIKDKSGNATEINILLYNLLDEQGIEVKPLLLSTRNNGHPTKIFPVISEFNYLLVYALIDSNVYTLDATNRYLDFGEIPFYCLNQYGRLLNFKSGSTWFDIAAPKPSIIQYQSSLKFLENENLTGSITINKTGYHALDSKKDYFSNPNQYLENLKNSYQDIEIIKHTVNTEDKSASLFNETLEVEMPFDNSSTLYLDVFTTKFFKENPFKLQNRTYPIDFGFKDTFYNSGEIDLNNLYEVVSLPKNLNMSLPDNSASALFHIVQEGDKVKFNLKISFNQELYPSNYYSALKNLMAQIVDVQKNSIVILKKRE